MTVTVPICLSNGRVELEYDVYDELVTNEMIHFNPIQTSFDYFRLLLAYVRFSRLSQHSAVKELESLVETALITYFP